LTVRNKKTNIGKVDVKGLLLPEAVRRIEDAYIDMLENPPVDSKLCVFYTQGKVQGTFSMKNAIMVALEE